MPDASELERLSIVCALQNRNESLFLFSVGKNSRLYSTKSTLMSTVGRECCMSGSSVSTHMKSHFKCLLYGCCQKCVYQRTLYHKLLMMTYTYLV